MPQKRNMGNCYQKQSESGVRGLELKSTERTRPGRSDILAIWGREVNQPEWDLRKGSGRGKGNFSKPIHLENERLSVPARKGRAPLLDHAELKCHKIHGGAREEGVRKTNLVILGVTVWLRLRRWASAMGLRGLEYGRASRGNPKLIPEKTLRWFAPQNDRKGSKEWRMKRQDGGRQAGLDSVGESKGEGEEFLMDSCK